jgi:two-component system response regulator PilR (NtrC family)
MTTQILPRVLIVEDLREWQTLYRVWLRDKCHLVFAENRVQALQQAQRHPFDVIIMDLGLPGGLPGPKEGILTIREIFEVQEECKIIVVTEFNERDFHLQVQKLGVYAVFVKDHRLESELPVFIRKAYEILSLEKENDYLRSQIQSRQKEFEILGNSSVAEQLRQKIRNISKVDTPVILTGPTGSGKNYFAKLIHYFSPRRHKPFVTINCAALPEQLVESELFGHVKGSFTGAETSATGRFKSANGGSILLDEIAEIPVKIQAKLLQVIEDKSFYPVGSTEKIAVDVRIIAATNHDLNDDIQKGIFRKDLYYRLAGFTMPLPSLKDRKEDIPDFFDYYLSKYSEEDGLPVPAVDPAVYRVIRNHPWQGNIRELKNVAYRLVWRRLSCIGVNDLNQALTQENHHLPETLDIRDRSMKEMCARYSQDLMNRYQSKKEVAEILQIDAKTLNRYLKMKVDK